MEADRKQRLSSHDEGALLFLSPYPRGGPKGGRLSYDERHGRSGVWRGEWADTMFPFCRIFAPKVSITLLTLRNRCVVLSLMTTP